MSLRNDVDDETREEEADVDSGVGEDMVTDCLKERTDGWESGFVGVKFAGPQRPGF